MQTNVAIINGKQTDEYVFAVQQDERSKNSVDERSWWYLMSCWLSLAVEADLTRHGNRMRTAMIRSESGTTIQIRIDMSGDKEGEPTQRQLFSVNPSPDGSPFYPKRV